MYTDKKRRRWPWLVLAACVIVLAATLSGWITRVPGRDAAETSAEAVKEAVQRSALQCYVVEGVYPPNLSYLEEHYGLKVNHGAFIIVYDAFASNLPPDVRVIPRGQ